VGGKSGGLRRGKLKKEGKKVAPKERMGFWRTGEREGT